MSSSEEVLAAKTIKLGEQIGATTKAKGDRTEFHSFTQELVGIKAQFREVTGRNFGDAALNQSRKKIQQKQSNSNKVNFGDATITQSHKISERRWTNINNLDPSLDGQKVIVRGHLQKSRRVGKCVFVVIRSTLYTVQGVAFKGKEVCEAMIKYISNLPLESVVDMEGIVVVLGKRFVSSVTQKMVEIKIKSFKCVNRAMRQLPFMMEDACRSDIDITNPNENEDAVKTVSQKMRLDYRWIDLRTPANQAIFRIESMVGCLFRECLLKKRFIEIHPPKLVAIVGKGYNCTFALDYFGNSASLATSPQFHMQMAAACAGFERVFTSGPSFPAVHATTRKHLCEFTGLCMEMAIEKHYDEILDVFSDLFIYIFDGLNERCRVELERTREQHLFEDIRYCKPALKITHAEGCELLRNAGTSQNDYECIHAMNEKELGNIIKEKYGTDLFFMDKYPLDVCSFRTMPCPEDTRLSNSFKCFVRGEEVLSGAQRIHDPGMLERRATDRGIDPGTLDTYLGSFRNGAFPHGGGNIGLERVVMSFLDLPNIRKASIFPRDSKRLTP